MQLRYTHTDTRSKASILNRNWVLNVSVYSMRISRTTIIMMFSNFLAQKKKNEFFLLELNVLLFEKSVLNGETSWPMEIHTNIVVYANGGDAKRKERGEKQSQNTQIFSIDTQ